MDLCRRPSRVLPPSFGRCDCISTDYIDRRRISIDIHIFTSPKPFLEPMVRLRLVDGDVIHISTALMQLLLEDESIGRFKRCSNQLGGGYSHSTSSYDRQARLNIMIVEYKLYHEDEAMET